ncbi:FxsA family protein [Actinomycetes bacterium KLBMP 9797]
MRYTPLLLVLTAVLEFTVFVLLASWIGLGWTILAVLATSLLGLTLLRREGMRAWRGFTTAVNAGQPPGDKVTDGLLGLAAGLLLTVPGFVTAVAGLLLAVPPVRGLARRGVRRWTERRVSPAAVGDLFGPRRVRVKQGPPDPGTPIEGEVV